MRARTWFKEKPQSPNTRDPALPGFVCRHNRRTGDDPDAFSLLEMMMVVTVILIVASIATPIYTSVVTRAREAVLRDHLIGNRE
jgi:prepilin-type N-terminal cleavage/methylation domain-containing protein